VERKRPDFAGLAEVQEQVRGRCQDNKGGATLRKRLSFLPMAQNHKQCKKKRSRRFSIYRDQMQRHHDQNAGAKGRRN
jgi:hypothetical protein